MATPGRATPTLPSDNGPVRQSPFRRQQSSASPAPTLHPNYTSPATSPTKQALKQSPFVRRPSQIGQPSDRPTSPFPRPNSALQAPPSPLREPDSTSKDRGPSNFVAETSPVSRAAESSEIPASNESPATMPFQSTLRPISHQKASPPASSPQRTLTSNSANRPLPSGRTALTKPHNPAANIGFTHIPQPLLRSMRESFEVLDATNAGAIHTSNVAAVLEQLGHDVSPATLRSFFPSSSSSSSTNLNLARYLDILATPLADLSPPAELLAAFEAFDIDDSGQVDREELKRALMGTGAMSEEDIDAVLASCSGRRAFGAKGSSHLATTRSKGEVFRYRDFMTQLSGGGMGSGQEQDVGA